MGFPGGSVVKTLPANAGAAGDSRSISGLERASGGGNGNPLQCSCQDNPMDRGAWWATVHWVAKNQTQLSVHKIISNHFVLCVLGADSVGMYVSWCVHVSFACPSAILSSIRYLFFSGINSRSLFLLFWEQVLWGHFFHVRQVNP